MAAEVSRRQFLTTAALASGGALAAWSALAGDAVPAALASESADPDADPDAAQKKAQFEALQQPIPPEPVPAAWDEELEVIVVGSGGGGCFSAIRLGNAGYKVTLIERNFEIGGSTKYGANTFCNFGGHRRANEMGWAIPEFPYNPEKVVEYLLNVQNFSGDMKLMYEMAVEGPKCIDWMVDELGLNWHGSAPVPPAMGQMMLFDENEQFIPYFLRFDIYQKFLDAAGVDIRLETEVVALVADEGGAVVGVKVATADGEKYLRATRAVCLLAGGFELNRALMTKYCPDCCRGIANIATMPYATGEVFRMGLGVGADVAGFDAMGAFETGIWWKDYDEYDPWFASYPHNADGNTVLRQPWLRINKLGDRVPYFSTRGTSYPWTPRLGEMVSADGMCDQASLEMSQPDGRTYVCFDAKGYDLCMADAFEERVCRWVGENPHGDFAEMPEAQRWYSTMQYAIENGGIKMADTIEELEAQLGLEPGILVDNVARWNEACEKGEDYMVAFKYPPQWLNPIDTPPYYGAVVGGNPFGTKCGLMIDPKMRVMGTNGKPIPGLYAGWHTAGGSSGENNYGGRPGTGIYGDGALSYIGGYMVAGSIIAEDGREG